MAKIVHISDIHWRGNSRHKEYTRAFEQLYSQVKEIKPDFIVMTGDFFHTKNTGLTNEVVERMAWMFRSLEEIAPVRSILGNHDGSLKNEQREDAITPIFTAIGDNKNNILYKKSGNYIDCYDSNINWCVFSCFDKDAWNEVSPLEDKINIALYHGSITGCIVGNNHSMSSGEESISRFSEYDFVLMGDIHKQQYMSFRKDRFGTERPNSGYPGSFVQQNFGEDEQKGFLVWDIKSKDEWTVDFIQVENFQPYISINWSSNPKTTVDKLLNLRKALSKKIHPGSRIRILSEKNISKAEREIFEKILKDEYSIEEVVYKTEEIANTDKITAGGISITKDKLKNNSETIIELYNEYILQNKKKNNVSSEQIKIAEEVIKTYIQKIEEEQPEEVARNVFWDLKKLEFDNVFRYGTENIVDFAKLNGIVGLFGNNRIGKSSIVGALMYGLFNSTDRGSMKNAHVIRHGESECKVKIQFESNDEQYFIERITKLEESSKKKAVEETKTSTDLDFYKIDKDNNVVRLNGDDRIMTDKRIQKTIGTDEDFLITSLSSQGEINRFINEGATKRKELLSRFLNLDIFNSLAKIAKADLNEYNALSKKYSQINFDLEIKNLEKSIQEKTSLLVVIEDKIKSLEDDLDKTKKELVIFEQKHNFDTIRVLERELNIKEIEYDKVKNEYVQTEKEISDLNKKHNENNAKLTLLNMAELSEKIEKAQATRMSATEINSQLGVEKHTLDAQEKSIKKLDIVPCGDSYPTCVFIKDSHENKKIIDEQKNKVNELTEKLNEYQNIIKEFVDSKTIEKFKEAKILTEEQKNVENRINVLNERLSSKNLSKILDEKNKLLKNLNDEKSKINSKDAERKEELTNSYKELSSAIKLHDSEKSSILVSLGSMNEKKSQFIQNKNEMNEIIEKVNIQQTIYNAFSKTGIPTMILESQLPAINQEIEKILAGVSDFGVELKTSSSSNAMDIYITHNDTKRIVETASGMEKMFCSLAIRVALSNLSSLPKSNIFIIDEGFGVLDENNIDLCLQMLQTLKNYYKTILIISHISEVKEVVDHIIEIKNNGKYSYVSN